MKLQNQTSDPNECVNFSSKTELENLLYAPGAKNKSFSSKYGYHARPKNQKIKKKSFWVVHTDPPNLGSAQKLEKLSTLGLYCTVNKAIRNILFVTIKEPLTRPFQKDSFSIVGECPKFRNFQILTKK